MPRPDIVTHNPLPGARLSKALPLSAQIFFMRVFAGELPPLNKNEDLFMRKKPGKNVENAESSAIADSLIPAKTLLGLSPDKLQELRVDLRRIMQSYFSRGQWNIIAREVYSDTQSNTIAFNPSPTRRDQTPLTPEYKEILLTSPDLYVDATLKTPYFQIPLMQGTRHIDEYPIGKKPQSTEETPSKIPAVIEELRARTGRDKLYVLDLGGSTGLAAAEIEQIDPNVDVTNVTIHPEPALYDLRGGHAFVAAEALPNDFAEQFELVISNVAFEHMKYPHLALANAILAATPGGIIDIHFNWDGYHLNTSQYTMKEALGYLGELGQKAPKVFEWLEKLISEGVLTKREGYQLHPGQTKLGDPMPTGRIALTKNASITQEHLAELARLLEGDIEVQ